MSGVGNKTQASKIAKTKNSILPGRATTALRITIAPVLILGGGGGRTASRPCGSFRTRGIQEIDVECGVHSWVQPEEPEYSRDVGEFYIHEVGRKTGAEKPQNMVVQISISSRKIR